MQQDSVDPGVGKFSNQKRIGVVVPCFNEEDNVDEVYSLIKEVLEGQPDIDFNILFIDNASTDRTLEKLINISANDHRVRIIENVRNFGHIRSPYYGVLQMADHDAVILLAADLQDPPSLIPEFIKKWKEGYKVVMGVKVHSQETPIFYLIRTIYYRLLQAVSEIKLVEHATGFGLYDQQVISTIKSLNDPYPYFRGLVAELGYPAATIAYDQPKRRRGITKNNFYTLYDIAMLGFTNHSKLPLRIAALSGFVTAIISFLVGLMYLVYKLIKWDSFSLGLAPVIIGLFFVGSVQLLFLGIVGEYIGAIYTQVLKRPLVVEKERINFPQNYSL